MFTSADHDASIVRAGLGAPAVGGFFAAGEIGPVGGANHLHGFTAVLLIVDHASIPEAGTEVRRPDDSGQGVDADAFDAGLRTLLEPPA